MNLPNKNLYGIIPREYILVWRLGTMEIMTTRELKEHLGELQGQEVTLRGWIRNHRKQKNMGFIDFFDGTCFKNPQVVYDNTVANYHAIQAYHVGSAVRVRGKVVPSYRDPETPEVQAAEIILEGDCPEDYPLQPKRHTVEFLRDIAYLRPVEVFDLCARELFRNAAPDALQGAVVHGDGDTVLRQPCVDFRRGAIPPGPKARFERVVGARVGTTAPVYLRKIKQIRPLRALGGGRNGGSQHRGCQRQVNSSHFTAPSQMKPPGYLTNRMNPTGLLIDHALSVRTTS